MIRTDTLGKRNPKPDRNPMRKDWILAGRPTPTPISDRVITMLDPNTESHVATTIARSAPLHELENALLVGQLQRLRELQAVYLTRFEATECSDKVSDLYGSCAEAVYREIGAQLHLAISTHQTAKALQLLDSLATIAHQRTARRLKNLKQANKKNPNRLRKIKTHPQTPPHPPAREPGMIPAR